MSYMYMPGATAIGITYDEGIVFASERRIAYGNFLVSKTTKKTFQITPKVGAACAGLVGVLTRISASILSIIMLGAIFHVKGAMNFTGEGAYEYDLLLLAASLVIIVAGPGRISIAHIIKKMPRFLH